jgi:hypothetical protein
VKKLLVYVLVIFLAIVAAGFYGVVHDQISYTVAPEYFTKFKFIQFGLTDTPASERVRASIIGFLASWWMGLPIGLLVGAAGFIHRGPQRMLKVSLWSIMIAAGFTLCFGLCGLVYGYLQTRHVELAQYQNWFIPEDVTDLRRFLCAGYMHNASYLGGAFAIPVAWAFHVVTLLRAREGARPVAEAPRQALP